MSSHGASRGRGSSRQSDRGSLHEEFLPVHGRVSPRVTPGQVIAFTEDEEESVLVAFCKDVFTARHLKMTGVLVLFIICGTAETINYSVNGQRFMAQYLTVLNILVVMGGTIFFNAIVAVKTYKGDYHNMEGWARSEHKLWFFTNIAGIAFCDTIALYLGILASNTVTAPLRTLLQQGSIPASMVVSWFFLHRRYRPVHVAGAGIIVCGIALASYQVITSHGNPGQNSKRVMNSNSYWAMVFFLSCIPMSLGACLKEYILTHETKRVEMNQVNAWVAVCQLGLGILLSPLSFFVTNWETDISHMPENMLKGFKCGIYGDLHACNDQCDHITSGPHKGPDCGLSLAPLSVWTYVAICCVFNLLMLFVIKEGTAVLFWISSAAIIPVVSLCSTSSLFTWLDLDVVAFSPVQICGLVLVVVGIAVYRAQPEDLEEDDEEEDDGDFDAVQQAAAHLNNSFKDSFKQSLAQPPSVPDRGYNAA